MSCVCSTRWIQREKFGTARIVLGIATFSVPRPTYTPTPNPPINIGGGSWSFKVNNPGGDSPSVTLASNQKFASQNVTPPFSIGAPCQPYPGSGGSACDCVNTNGGSGTAINTTPRPNEVVGDSNLNNFTKSGKWVWTWTSGAQQPVDGPATERVRTARVKHTITVKDVKYCNGHSCPGGGSTTTNDNGDTATFLSEMITLGNTQIAQASN